jgi:HTH-type transcriptional regulator, transcriptional repressor of NAD biosynthesis genes
MTSSANPSANRFRRGLIVGKFCPLHRGHESVILRAIDCCDEVIVISYTKPEFAGCGRATRAAWIKDLFPSVTALVIDDAALRQICRALAIPAAPEVPHNDASDTVHRDFVGWLCLAVLQKTVDAVFTSEGYGDGFAAALSAYFQVHAQTDTAVHHESVDQSRRVVQISGTMIRADVHACRQFLAPQVYTSFVQRICILGGESSGKTTLARSLAERLGTVWAEEYGRELWERKNGKLGYEDMLRIARAQVAREAALSAQARRWLFCDTSPLTTLFYSLALFGRASPGLRRQASRSYDRVFLCAPDFPFVQDGTRRDPAFRDAQHKWYVEQLGQRGVKFSVLSGSVDARVASAVAALPGPAAETVLPPRPS